MQGAQGKQHRISWRSFPGYIEGHLLPTATSSTHFVIWAALIKTITEAPITTKPHLFKLSAANLPDFRTLAQITRRKFHGIEKSVESYLEISDHCRPGHYHHHSQNARRTSRKRVPEKNIKVH
jgi:hypothetical protein